MQKDFLFPDTGEGITEGTLIKWVVKEGDDVKIDQILAEVETDKAIVEIPSPVKGKIIKLHKKEGEIAKVGQPFVTFEPDSNGTPTLTKTSRTSTSKTSDTTKSTGLANTPAPVPEPQTANQKTANKTMNKQTITTPRVRKLAQDMNIDLSLVQGTGNKGQITEEDLLNYAHAVKTSIHSGTSKSVSTTTTLGSDKAFTVIATPTVSKFAHEKGIDLQSLKSSEPGKVVTKEDILSYLGEQPAGPSIPTGGPVFGARTFDQKNYAFENYGSIEKIKMSQTRITIAEQMERSVYTIPHVTHSDDIDITRVWSSHKELKEKALEKGIHLTLLPFIIKALINAVKKFPLMNASLDEISHEIILKKYYNIGIATATESGLLVPNIKNADQKSLLELATEIKSQSEKARARKNVLDDFKGGTITITNYGSVGGKYASPIINYPEVAILGIGKVSDEPKVLDGEIKIRKILPISISFDHRIVDGAYAAQFANELKHELENPELLLL